MEGNLAPSGTYTVVLEACDIYNNCDEARGKVDIPFVAFIAPPTSTPMPTVEKTETEQIWYSTPTPVPSHTATPTEQIQPIFPATGGDDSGDGNVPSGSNQPLLPLAAVALGTSVLLAASSRREEREAQATARLDDMQNASTAQQDQDLADREASVADQTVATVNEETPYVEVSTLAELAGVVKETFTGIWEDAVRISAADAPITIVTHNWVNGVDPEKRLQEIAENDAFIEWYYFNIYLPNKKIEEQKAAEEAQRLAEEQWLAEQQAAAEAAAKEMEEAAAAAARKAAALDAKLARMEEQTAGNNIVVPNQTAPVSKTQAKEVADGGDETDDGNWLTNVGNALSSAWSVVTGLGKNTKTENQNSLSTTVSKDKENVAGILNSISNGLGILHDMGKTLGEITKDESAAFLNDASNGLGILHDMGKTTGEVAKDKSAAYLNDASNGLGILHDMGKTTGEVAKDKSAAFMNVQINGLGILHDVVGKPVEIGIQMIGSLLKYASINKMAATFGYGPNYDGLGFVSDNKNVIQDTNTSKYVSDIALGAGFAAESEHMGNFVDIFQNNRSDSSDAFGPGGFTQNQINEMKNTTEYDDKRYEEDRFIFLGNSTDPNDVTVVTQAMIIRIESNLTYKGDYLKIQADCTETDKLIISLMSHNVGFNISDIADNSNFINSKNDIVTINWESYFDSLGPMKIDVDSGTLNKINVGFNNLRAGDQNYNTQFMLKLGLNDINELMQNGWTLPDGVNLDYIEGLVN